MSDIRRVTRLSELHLSVEDRETVAEVTADLIAVNVYRELQRANESAKAAWAMGCAIIGNCSNGSCNIIGNCSSSSKSELLDRTVSRFSIAGGLS